ncbi:MAG: DEAD/DEAH box helicase, partial [Kiritimatiellaeota bacterium]|nr:DEAD/DEAH box helicase [Kiritimatiellota bacterium]
GQKTPAKKDESIKPVIVAPSAPPARAKGSDWQPGQAPGTKPESKVSSSDLRHRIPARTPAQQQEQAARSARPHDDRPRDERPRESRPQRGGRPTQRGPRRDGPRDDRRGPAPQRGNPQLSAAPATVTETVPAQPAAPWDPSSFQVPVEEGKLRFQDFNLAPELMHAIADLKFQYCTPIQGQILPHTLAGKDAAGQAQTGTGKTAAFLLAIMQRAVTNPIANRKPGAPRALVLAPTRELVMQIQKDAQLLGKYSGFKSVAVFGGMDYEKQKRQVDGHVIDLIAATPGRLIDFLRSRLVDLSQVETLVLDEADRMLDMGFIPDVRRIISQTPSRDRRQTLLFSATLSKEVMRLASQWMRDFVKIDIEPEHRAVDTVEQKIYVVTRREKINILMHLLQSPEAERVLIFRNRRDSTNRLYERLTRAGIRCAQLSGDVAQEKRVRILEEFREGKLKVVVATDVAGRGIHVAGISHVVNYDIPEHAEDFVHRIGRTGRAGVSGEAITFADEESGFMLPAIEEFIGRPLTYIHPDDALRKPPTRSNTG